eukprot:COSAG04_NODE_2002_length_5029_cov_5.314604_4_plen_217_part_00
MEGSDHELAAARLPPSAATRARFAVATSQAASRARLRSSSRTRSGHVQERGAEQPAGPPVVKPGKEAGGGDGPKGTSTEQQDAAAPQPEPEPQFVAADSSYRPAEGFRAGCTIYDHSPERPPGLQVRHDGKRDGKTPTEDPSGMPQPVALSAAVQDCGLNADHDSCQTQSGVRPRDSAALAPGAEQQRAAGGNHDDSSDAQPALKTVDLAGKANTG